MPCRYLRWVLAASILEVQTLDTWPQLRKQGLVALDELHVQQESTVSHSLYM